MYPEMEGKLYDEYMQLRSKVLKFRAIYWFKICGKQLLTQMNRTLTTTISSSPLLVQCICHKISFRLSTNLSQKPPDDKQGVNKVLIICMVCMHACMHGSYTTLKATIH